MAEAAFDGITQRRPRRQRAGWGGERCIQSKRQQIHLAIRSALHAEYRGELYVACIENEQNRFVGRSRLDVRDVSRLLERTADPRAIRSKQSEPVVAARANDHRFECDVCEPSAGATTVPEGFELPLLRSEQRIRVESERVGGSGSRTVRNGRGVL